jgi:hypothetical protein
MPSPTDERLNQFLEQVGELNPEALSFDGFDNCIVGVGQQFTKDPVLVYDEFLMLNHLCDTEGWEVDEAYEYLCFNTFGAWMGEGTPIVIRSLHDC